MNQDFSKVQEISCRVDGQTYSLSSRSTGSGVTSHHRDDQDRVWADEVVGGDLISLFLDAGVPVPYSCREGDCSSCIARVVKGAVEELPSDVLAETDRELGYIVACRALPKSSQLEVTFDD